MTDNHSVSSNAISTKSISTTEKININSINITTPYSQCQNPLEFIIISLSNSFNITPRQSIAILSNNRKYLNNLCINGIKGDYTAIASWLTVIKTNIDSFINILTKYEDGSNIASACVGAALCSKHNEAVLLACDILLQFKNKLGCDWSWFANEGLDSFIFALIRQHNNETLINIYKALETYIETKENDFIIELKKRTCTNEGKKKIYKLLNVITPVIFESDKKVISNTLKSFVFDFLLSEENDIAVSVSLLAEYWLIYESSIDETLTNNILSYLSNAVNSVKDNHSLCSLSHMFNMLDQFSEHKSNQAPPLYKLLVSLFIDNYSNEHKREHALLSFTSFLFKFHKAPIDILFTPYITTLKSASNYNLSDIRFIIKFLEHPRMTGVILYNIIEFVLQVNLDNNVYSGSVGVILKIIIEDNLLGKYCSVKEIKDIFTTFTTYVKLALKVFISSVNYEGVADVGVLESVFDIMCLKNEQMLREVDVDVKTALINYREMKGSNSTALLALLWFFKDHDEFLLNLEESFRVEYEPVVITMKKIEQEKIEREKKDLVQQAKNEIQRIKTKQYEQKKLQQQYEENEKQKIKTMKKQLDKKRKQQCLMLGISVQHPNNNGGSALYNEKSVLTGVNSTKKIKLKTNETSKQLLTINYSQKVIMPEGSMIKHVNKDEDNLSFKSKSLRRSYITSEVYRNFILPIDLTDEENRETIAIQGYNKQYKKNLHLYFINYANERTLTITKSKILIMLRNSGFTKEDINLEELNIVIRKLFKENLTELSFEQFCSLLVQLAYLIFTKVRDTLTISECYGNICKYLLPPQITEGTRKTQKALQPVLDLINQKLRNPKDEDDQYFNMPPGFKIQHKTSVKYNYRLPLFLYDVIGESKFICFELVEEIFYKAFKSSTLEAFVKVNKYDELVIETGELRYWSKDVTIAYMNLDQEYEEIGKECADCLEAMLKKLCGGRDREGNVIVPPLEKNEQQALMEYQREEKLKEERRLKRFDVITAQVKEYKIKREEDYKLMKMKEKEDKEKYVQEMLKRKEKVKKRVEEVKARKKQKDEEKQKLILEKEEKEKAKLKKLMKLRNEYFEKQKLKIEEEFEKLHQQRINEVAEREKIMKLEEEKYIHPRRPKYLKKRQNSASLPKKKTIDESNKDDGYTQFKSRYPKYLKKYKKQKETENKNDNEGDDYVDNTDDQQNKTAIN